MTLVQFHKRLSKLLEEGYGRCHVAVDKSTFRDNREGDGCCILHVEGLGVVSVLQSDDDGWVRVNKDGTESTRRTVVLAGAAGADMKGNLVAEHNAD